LDDPSSSLSRGKMEAWPATNYKHGSRRREWVSRERERESTDQS
jgi:hypothetical protein